jgi:hypothetical protein
MTQDQGSQGMKAATATVGDVKRLLGPMDDGISAAIVAMNPSISELEEVAAWLAGEDDVMGELERPLAGVAGQIYELLAAAEEEEEER